MGISSFLYDNYNRAKNLPEEVRKRLREMASYEIDKFYWEQQHKKK
jgi:hypothetical protein